MKSIIQAFNFVQLIKLNIEKKYFYFFVGKSEPVGAKPPTFSNDFYSFSYIRSAGQSFALLCQAQAFPVPIIRYVTLRVLTD